MQYSSFRHILKTWLIPLLALTLSLSIGNAQAPYRPCRVSFYDSHGLLECTKGGIRAWSCHVWPQMVLPSNLAQPNAIRKEGIWFIPWQELECRMEEGLEPYFAGDFGLKGSSGLIVVRETGDTMWLHSPATSDWIFDLEPNIGYPGLPLLLPFSAGISTQESQMSTESRLLINNLHYRDFLIEGDQLPLPEYSDRVIVLEVLGKQFKAGEKVQVSLVGAIYDGGSHTPFYTIQRKGAQGWEIAYDNCCEQIDDAFYYWRRRDEILDLFILGKPTANPEATSTMHLDLPAGVYRLVMYDRYMRAKASGEFVVE